MPLRERKESFLCFITQVSEFHFHYRWDCWFILSRIAHAVNVIDSVKVLRRICRRVYLIDASSNFPGWYYGLSIRQRECCMRCPNISVWGTMGTRVEFNDARPEVRVICIKPDEFLHMKSIDFLVGDPSNNVPVPKLVLFHFPDSAFFAECLCAGHHFIGNRVIRSILLSV